MVFKLVHSHEYNPATYVILIKFHLLKSLNKNAMMGPHQVYTETFFSITGM